MYRQATFSTLSPGVPRLKPPMTNAASSGFVAEADAPPSGPMRALVIATLTSCPTLLSFPSLLPGDASESVTCALTSWLRPRKSASWSSSFLLQRLLLLLEPLMDYRVSLGKFLLLVIDAALDVRDAPLVHHEPAPNVVEPSVHRRVMRRCLLHELFHHGHQVRVGAGGPFGQRGQR